MSDLADRLVNAGSDAWHERTLRAECCFLDEVSAIVAGALRELANDLYEASRHHSALGVITYKELARIADEIEATPSTSETGR